MAVWYHSLDSIQHSMHERNLTHAGTPTEAAAGSAPTMHTEPGHQGGLQRGAINTFRPRQDGLYFPDSIFKCIFLNENV